MSEVGAEIRAFLAAHRQAALAVVDGGAPFTAMVSYALGVDSVSPLIHLSNLAAHKRMVRASPLCSLLVAEPDTGAGDVLALKRVALQCQARMLDRTSDEYSAARARYLHRLPTSAVMFTLADFDLFQLEVVSARYVAGFGRAISITGAQLRAGAD